MKLTFVLVISLFISDAVYAEAGAINSLSSKKTIKPFFKNLENAVTLASDQISEFAYYFGIKDSFVDDQLCLVIESKPYNELANLFQPLMAKEQSTPLIFASSNLNNFRKELNFSWNLPSEKDFSFTLNFLN